VQLGTRSEKASLTTLPFAVLRIIPTGDCCEAFVHKFERDTLPAGSVFAFSFQFVGILNLALQPNL
jgi:hypothetical protein